MLACRSLKKINKLEEDKTSLFYSKALLSESNIFQKYIELDDYSFLVTLEWEAKELGLEKENSNLIKKEITTCALSSNH